MRVGTISEAQRVHALIPEFVEKTRRDDYLAARLKGKEHLVLIAEAAKTPVGYVLAYDRYGDGSYYCWMAGVAPRARRKGALSALMARLEREARAKGYERLRVTTRNTRREMLGYLVKEGYHAIAVKRRERVEENRVVFEKALGV